MTRSVANETVRMENMESETMGYEVKICDVGPQPLAAVRGHANAQNFLGQLFVLLDEVWTFLRANPHVKHEGLNVFLYDHENDSSLLDTEQVMRIEAGVKVAEPFTGSGRVVCSATPSGTVATVAHIGPYDKLSEAHSAVRTWCKDHNHPIAGASWEIYDHWNDDPNKLRTDVFYLLK
jgi:effector-binding domain-containing protein